jgi:hypothetical protein
VIRTSRWKIRPRGSLAAVVLGTCVCLGLQSCAQAPSHVHALPPAAGYFNLLPVGSYASLPSDSRAAAEVRRSPWEPRPGNSRYNHTTPVHLVLRRPDLAARAYDPRWSTYVLGRITGQFKGTTDEIFQWTALKWGLPDNLIRAIAYVESDWRQPNYGDFVNDPALCPGGHRPPCPVTFGIVGTKSTSWPGLFPWNSYSTAAAVDVLGGWLRGCYEGWVWWLRSQRNGSPTGYRAGDIWGCVGAWYSGEWLDGPAGVRGTAENYISRVRHWYYARPWLHSGF